MTVPWRLSWMAKQGSAAGDGGPQTWSNHLNPPVLGALEALEVAQAAMHPQRRVSSQEPQLCRSSLN